MMPTATDLRATLKVGLEIHVELATRSKMWTSAPNIAHPDYFEAAPNTLLDPVVIGMPGTLPVMNQAAVEMSIKVGLALGCQIARHTKWDRKSYYYPDLPKNYQISQYDLPLCYEGHVELPDGKTIRITRAHLEEDAGKLLHEAPGGIPIDHSIVDLNRAGTPLLEIVTEPDFESSAQVVQFCQMLRDIVRHLGVSEAIMQRGQMRFEPNINVVIESGGQTYKTPIVEIKNLNSFRAVAGAIDHEYDRQVKEWQATGKVMGARAKTTRGWDDVRGVTVLQREKEDADEYRYFPDPDLVPLDIDDTWLERLGAEVGELPHQTYRRLVDDLGISPTDARGIIDEPALTHLLQDAGEKTGDPKRVAAMLLNYGQKHANDRGVPVSQLDITADQVAGIVALLEQDKISSSGADKLFGICCDPDADGPAEDLAQQHGLLQVSDTNALEGYVEQVLADPKSSKAVEDIKAGKDKAVGALLGQIMKLSKGQANPKLVREMIFSKVRG